MSAPRSKERIEFDYLLKKVAGENLAQLHQQAQPMRRTAQLQAISSGPRHVPLHLTPPPPERQRSTTPYQPPAMGTPRAGAYDALHIPSLNHPKRHQT